jgi:hypothetical protein
MKRTLGRTLEVERHGRGAGTGSSLVQGSPKRNIAVARRKPAIPEALRQPISRRPIAAWNALYSIVTASRPINLATSSNWSES